jgi:hypothetical protein
LVIKKLAGTFLSVRRLLGEHPQREGVVMRSHIRGLGAAGRGGIAQLLKRRIHQDAVHDHGWEVVVFRLTAVMLSAVVALGLVAPAASAVPQKKLDDHLAALWTTALETPDAQNPFGSGGAAFACFNLGRTVAPFAPGGVESCTVKPGTKIFVAASSFECSTFEGHGTTEAQLRDCAREADVQVAPSVTVDGRSVSVAEVETRLLNIVLPENNIFGQPAGTTGLSVGHGWVVLLHPLTPGTHTIVIDLGTDVITTRIIVEPGH